MVARGSARLLLEAELRTAISSEQLRVHYQPQVALDSGAVVGVEALVRWDHPERGLLLPGSFIPMAEESGLVVALDQWVLDTACRQLAQWIDAGADAPRMAVNLSARSLQDPRVAAVVAGILERYQLPAAALELEVTETLAVRRPDDLLTVLMELRALGVSLAVDDFGSGYTVLAWLERWPLDRLKIDAQFVATITEASPRAPIVAALIALSHELGFRVVAEGVETPTQLATLRDLGCDEGQGFLLGRPQAGRPQPGHIAAFVRQVQ
jgi:EAL domain-containing protein (putative c-di-GMP-specific phosphodiesterase class I)